MASFVQFMAVMSAEESADTQPKDEADPQIIAI